MSYWTLERLKIKEQEIEFWQKKVNFQTFLRNWIYGQELIEEICLLFESLDKKTTEANNLDELISVEKMYKDELNKLSKIYSMRIDIYDENTKYTDPW